MTRKVMAIVIAGVLVSSNAFASSECVRPEDDLAMKTSVMQQELMVAALACGEASLYNSFVLSHRDELQKADAALLAFFERENGDGGQSSYHDFKTKAANVSSLKSARDQAGYCANSEHIFAAAYGVSLAAFVTSQWTTAAEFIAASCGEDGAPVTQASATPASAPWPNEASVPVAPAEPSLGN
jgi:hypothetical protein